mmetsp:Transcript_15530/g.35542  ORF Transcript_15530/g.35542 Transcript_15530/m.35542 type:complete len:221 (-) Transcript_15530:17-679(-)
MQLDSCNLTQSFSVIFQSSLSSSSLKSFLACSSISFLVIPFGLSSFAVVLVVLSPFALSLSSLPSSFPAATMVVVVVEVVFSVLLPLVPPVVVVLVVVVVLPLLPPFALSLSSLPSSFLSFFAAQCLPSASLSFSSFDSSPSLSSLSSLPSSSASRLALSPLSTSTGPLIVTSLPNRAMVHNGSVPRTMPAATSHGDRIAKKLRESYPPTPTARCTTSRF